MFELIWKIYENKTTHFSKIPLAPKENRFVKFTTIVKEFLSENNFTDIENIDFKKIEYFMDNTSKRIDKIINDLIKKRILRLVEK